MLNGDNMQGNASGVKCETQNGVSKVQPSIKFKLNSAKE